MTAKNILYNPLQVLKKLLKRFGNIDQREKKAELFQLKRHAKCSKTNTRNLQ